ncbi:MAG: gamma carbonic anhydrase family protein [Acholeplasmatales bacterium]|nr:MAG: gamma carbonic anhydrase family protein [Acholeplasmatales bacterium]
MLYPYLDKTPVIAEDAFVFPTAAVIGAVTLMSRVSIYFQCVVRGDMSPVFIDEDTNVQDGTVIHTDTNKPTRIGKRVTIGHAAIIHAATIEDDALIGMGAIVLDGATIGKRAFVAAGTLVPPGKTVPANTLAMGNPMKIVRTLDAETFEAMRQNNAVYLDLLKDYTESL